MRVLTIGATGFLGGAIAQRLLGQGHEVVAMVRDDAGAAWVEALGATARRGDLGDPEAIAAAAAGTSHAVCAAGIVSCRAAPRALRWTHVAGAQNLVNACRHAGLRRLVYVSCADVTLTPEDRVHWDENRGPAEHAFGERARSLQLAEELVLSTSGGHPEVVALRPAWAWGPGDLSRLPGLLREARAGGIRLVGDGRTYLATSYVEHVAEAAVTALDAPDAAGRAYYVVDPIFQHARDFFGALSEALSLPPPRSSAPAGVSWPLARLTGRGPGGLQPDEMLQRGRSSLFDFSAACGKLAYDPRVSFEDGLSALRRWVTEEGGVDAVAACERPAPDASAVDAQVDAAGGD